MKPRKNWGCFRMIDREIKQQKNEITDWCEYMGLVFASDLMFDCKEFG